MSAVYLPSLTFSAPNSAPSSRAASRAASIITPAAASRAPSVKAVAAKPKGEKKSLKSRVKSMLSRGTEEG
ncbi:hypothetical protein VC83_06679 [Pseudogymnoascus destructans]|uniref:Uncharacterized protein n=1 Tax=Pseudogymnoascus destructans TaxID=655981 RepID=A0A177A2H0_9PEZI|nr:uncharacterized protein VC83_06679 [Pseudogymnoascus destructans]OAF56358.1 hypothetical protein VC83_06679 [Pseudogymnoascus destructans]